MAPLPAVILTVALCCAGTPIAFGLLIRRPLSWNDQYRSDFIGSKLNSSSPVSPSSSSSSSESKSSPEKHNRSLNATRLCSCNQKSWLRPQKIQESHDLRSWLCATVLPLRWKVHSTQKELTVSSSRPAFTESLVVTETPRRGVLSRKNGFRPASQGWRFPQ